VKEIDIFEKKREKKNTIPQSAHFLRVYAPADCHVLAKPEGAIERNCAPVPPITIPTRQY
jgi:hypothetical protein